jgi:hypothetical protein
MYVRMYIYIYREREREREREIGLGALWSTKPLVIHVRISNLKVQMADLNR